MIALSLMRPVRTHCPFCAFQCGTVVSPEGNQLRIEGDESFPINQGRMCIKGFRAGELHNRPDRLLTPLIRDASGKLCESSWEEALDLVADRFRQLRANHGPDSVAVFGSGALTNEKAYYLAKFARVALKTANIDYNGRYCMSSGAAGNNLAFGIDRGMPFPMEDLPLAGTILLVGSNPVETLPPMTHWLQAQRQAGGKLIVIDPRQSATALMADLHLAPVPGTDLTLLNGMLHLIIETGKVDQDFIAARTSGFEAAKANALSHHPARVEQITGVSESQMRLAVDWLGDDRPAMVLSGRGPEQQSKGVATVLACANLVLALGKSGKPGSGYGCLTGQANGQGGREHGQKADQLPGYRSITDPAHRSHIASIWGVAPEDLPTKGLSAFELLDALGQPGGPKGLLVVGSNIVVASPDVERVKSRLGALDFLVVLDAFSNETSEGADVILPVTQWMEETGTTTNLEGRVILRRKVTEAPGQAMSDIWILRELAKRLGVGDKFSALDPELVFAELAKATAGGKADYAGITWPRIDRENGIFWPCPSQDHPGTKRLFLERFGHPDGRAKFHATPYSPAAEEPDKEYPLYFTTGRNLEHYNSGAQTRRMESLVLANPDPVLKIHPELAMLHGINEGEMVEVESRRGAARFVAGISPDIRPDTLFAPFHWGGMGAANLLTNPALDPISRMPEFKVCASRIKSKGAIDLFLGEGA